MNSRLYKLVFSKAQGMYVAVCEFAKSCGSTSSKPNSQTEKKSDYKLPSIKELSALSLGIYTALAPSIAYAQSHITPHTDGNINHRPTLLQSVNGIPIVNIRTINDKGVSRNEFGRFDIDDKGVVLNNSRFSTNSQLAGRMDGNFWLLNGEASTIVNEIHNPNPSQINGKIEVAGQSANLIIASPNGININGGGFINANNSILTTGNVEYYDGLPVGVSVDKGVVNVGNFGLHYQNNTQNTPNFAQIFTQTAKIHGQITGLGNDFVQVITGQNSIGISPTVNATDIKPKTDKPSQTTHSVSVDIGQMGQVYADGIQIISTDKGIGVNVAGSVLASSHMTLQADGKIVNTGTLKTTSDDSLLGINSIGDTAGIVNTGTIHSKNSSLLSSAHDITNGDTAVILGDKSTQIYADNSVNFHKIDYTDTDTNLNITAKNTISSQSHAAIETKGNVSLIAQKQLHLTDAHIKSTGADKPVELISSDLNIKNSQISSTSGKIELGAKTLNLTNSQIENTDGQVRLVGETASLDGTNIHAQTVSTATTKDTQMANSHIHSDDLSVSSLGNVSSTNNQFDSKKVGVNAASDIVVQSSKIVTNETTFISDGSIALSDSHIHGENGNLHLQANKQTITNSSLVTEGSIAIHTKDDNKIDDTAVHAGKHLAISSSIGGITLDNTQDQVSANGLVLLQSKKDIALNDSHIKGGAITLNSKEGLVDWQNATLDTQKHELLANDESLRRANGSLTIKSHEDIEVLAGKTINSAGDLELSSHKNLILQGASGDNGRGSEQVVQLNAGGNIYLKGASIDLQGSQIIAQDGGIGIYATSGDLNVLGVGSPVKEFKDEERIADLTAQISGIENKINLLQTDVTYQDLLSKHADEQEQLDRLIKQHEESPVADFKEQSEAISQTIAQLSRQIKARADELGVGKSIDELNDDKKILDKSLKIAGTPFTGIEYQGGKLHATDDIHLAAKNAIAIQQADIKTKSRTVIQALGTDANRTIRDGDKELQVPIAISIEGLSDVYQRGDEGDDSFALHNIYTPTNIKADQGILIQAVGGGDVSPTQTTKDHGNNILLVGGRYDAKDGQITIQSLGSTILQAGQDSIYDKETNVTKRGKVKRKTIITTTTEEIQNADVVELNTNDITIEAGSDLLAYGSQFNVPDGQINISAGNAVKLLAVSEIDKKDVDVQKISRLFGIKYRKDKTHDSRQVLSELPTSVVATITQSKSGGNTELQGTQFDTLQRAHIQAGVGAKALPEAQIILSTVSTIISTEQNREYSNLVWQTVMGSGNIDETRELPSFTGALPTFDATGGIHVQVPINKDDLADKDHLVHVLTRLSHDPSFSYLEDIINRDDVDFTAIRLAQEEWNYKEEGLTPAAAAFIAMALTIATQGMGANFLPATVAKNAVASSMAKTAFSSLVSNAGVALVNNKGDVGKTLKQMGRSDNIKQIAQTVITAGVTSGLDDLLGKFNIDTSTHASINHKLVHGVVTGTGLAITDALLNGTDLEQALKLNLTNQLVEATAGAVYTHGVKPLDTATTNELINNLSHKLAAGLTGCLSAKAKDKSCEAGAVGAVIGEMVGDWMVNDHEITTPDGERILVLSDHDKQQILNTAKLTAGSVALLYDFDVDTAANEAEEAVENNAVWAAIPATIFVLGKLYTAYQVYQDIQDLKSGKKTVEQLAREKGEDYIAQAIAGNIGKYGYKIVKSGSRRIVQAVKKSCSFHGSTLISTMNGYKPISSIKIGDFVWSRDEYTGKYSYQPVTNWYHNQYQETVYVTIVDSQGNEQILISNTIHPFFAKVPYDTTTPVSSEGHDYQGEIDNGVWIDASNLQAGYQLLSEDGTWQTVKSVSIAKEALTAYNLTVDNTHTYFVSAQGGKYGVWVHNACKSQSLSNLEYAASPAKSKDGRLHGDISKIRSYVLGIGYNKEELIKAKSILEKSLSARRSDKRLYPQGLDDGHKRRINSEQELLNRVNQMLREIR